MSLKVKAAASLLIAVVLLVSPALPVYAQSPAKKININTATTEELQALPRVGPKIAQRIVDFRKENGKFQRVEDIMKVKGIGEKTFLRMRNMITVEETSAKKTQRTQKK